MISYHMSYFYSKVKITRFEEASYSFEGCFSFMIQIPVKTKNSKFLQNFNLGNSPFPVKTA